MESMNMNLLVNHWQPRAHLSQGRWRLGVAGWEEGEARRPSECRGTWARRCLQRGGGGAPGHETGTQLHTATQPLINRPLHASCQ